jgi:hypothetical protein
MAILFSEVNGKGCSGDMVFAIRPDRSLAGHKPIKGCALRVSKSKGSMLVKGDSFQTGIIREILSDNNQETRFKTFGSTYTLIK